MTLRSIKNRKKRGKIGNRSLYPQVSFISIKKAMEELAPGMAESAILSDSNPYTISFEAGKSNKMLEKRLKYLRNKTGIDFDYTFEKMNWSDLKEDKLGGFTRPDETKRLVITFSPDSDIEWAHIRTIFGLSGKLTDEVSSEEPINTVGDYE